MILEKIVISGFKSFADRTDFVFEPGLTVLVGPNGCGKSNVVDAVKWVLGEQSAKSLRGAEMADVIFNGSESRKPLGCAEVSLHIANAKRMLPVDYDEVCISRRLYRSGESEYLLNKQLCRLRDIKELFMDTGIGMDAYSVIEQGKIDLVLQANKKDRRLVFEEAAGISKYKAKKRAALLKLERVAQNLLRLGDILEEVQKRMRVVKRQATVARKYEEHRDNLREMRVAFALHRYHVLSQERRRIAQVLEAAADREAEWTVALDQIAAQASELEAQALELDRQITAQNNAEFQIQSQLSSAEQAIVHGRNRIKELGGLKARNQADMANVAQRLTEMKAELSSAIEVVAALEQQLRQHEEELAAKTAELERISVEVSSLVRELEERKAAHLELMRERSRRQNDLTALDTQQKTLEAQRTRLTAKIQTLREELAQLGQEKANLQAERQRLEEELAALEADLAQAWEQRDQLRQELDVVCDKIAVTRDEVSAKKSRRDLLLDLEGKLEGLDVGVKQILEELHSEDTTLSGIRGVVADHVQVDMQYAPSIEAALGDRAQCLITETMTSARQAIRFLTTSQGGRSSFLPLDSIRNGHPEVPIPPALAARTAGRALDLVQFDDAVEPAFDHLLKDVVVMNDLDAAVELSSECPTYATLVTLDGQIVKPGGHLTGGGSKAAPGLISRKSELNQLGQELQELQARLSALEAERSMLNEQISELERRGEELKGSLSSKSLELAERRNQFESLEAQEKRLRDEVELDTSDLEELRAQLEVVGTTRARLGEEIEILDEQERNLQAGIREAEAGLRQKEQARARLQDEAGELRVALATGREKEKGLSDTISRLGNSISEGKLALLRASDEIEECDQKAAECRAEIERKEAEIRGLNEQKHQLQRALAELKGQREELRARLEQSKEESRALESQISDLREEIQNFRIKENEANTNLHNLEERTADEHSISLVDRYTTGYEEEEEDIDWTALQESISDVKGKMERLGNVNLEAIDELRELETRGTFLTTQQQDLLKAQTALEDVIKKINDRSRQLFEKVFNDVREHFQAVFRKLFGGGKADVVLEEGVDILEAGVDIIARPPGKEPTSIAMLSGGEKVLTAVALLFAIFKSKPSPFCILDEVDAALDESNTDRFIALLKDFLRSTQFIVVTHSRRTMVLADAMYGVTMEESGVSKKVSVKFNELESNAA